MTYEADRNQPIAASAAGYQVPRIGSLCSGIGTLELGLITALGAGSVAWHVEYDKQPAAVLEARFPGVPNYGDVTTTDWSQVEPVDWLTAGYPCQPFSHAGRRRGSADERHLWPAVRDAIGVLRPGNVLLENVAGHVSLGLDAVLCDLAALGYDTRWGVVRAADAGACHGRARVFVAASDAAERGRRGAEGLERGVGPAERLAAAATHTDRVGPAHAADRAEIDGTPGGARQHARSERSGAAAPDADCAPRGRDRTGGVPSGSAEGVVPEAGRRAGRDRGSHPAADADSLGLQGIGGLVPIGRDTDGRGSSDIAWGVYEPAIRRWERLIGRPAPRPTEPGRAGQPRLSPRFVEWMQGLAAGYVTDILPRTPALKALGNCVVPQQAALAVSVLHHRPAVAA